MAKSPRKPTPPRSSTPPKQRKRGTPPQSTATATAADTALTKLTPKRATAVTRTGEWKPKFLDVLTRTGNVKLACDHAAVSRETAYQHRRGDAGFKLAWRRALADACDILEVEARRRAAVGVKRPVFQGGKLVGHEQIYSDTLLMFLMKGARPRKYRDLQRHEHTGPKGRPIETVTTLDLSKLSLNELREYRRITARAGAGLSGSN